MTHVVAHQLKLNVASLVLFVMIAGFAVDAPARPASAEGPWLSVASGRLHSCGVTTGNGVYCWGWNGEGRLGDNTTTRRDQPVKVNGLPAIAKVATGENFTCAISTGGALYCWGSNSHGQLGTGSIDSGSKVPIAVPGLTVGVLDVSLGDDFACAVVHDTTDEIKCWGGNAYGQLGTGNTTEQHSPTLLAGLTGAKAVAAGQTHACAVTSGSGVMCWGTNLAGQVGTGTSDATLHTPAAVSGLTSGVEQLAAGKLHSCAVKGTGEIVCWGSNSQLQLGDGTSDAQRNAPVTVAGFATGGSRVSAGLNHSCAITTAGGIKCWGEGTSGQLGNGLSVSSNNPVQVSSIAGGAGSIAAGGDDFSCAVVSNQAKCWGAGFEGELGDGGESDSLTPVDVSPPAEPENCDVLSLSVFPVGAPQVTVSPVPNCGDNEYEPGTSITLSASAPPQSHFEFDHWAGMFSGTANPLHFFLDGDTTVVANYRELATHLSFSGADMANPIALGTTFPLEVSVKGPAGGTISTDQTSLVRLRLESAEDVETNLLTRTSSTAQMSTQAASVIETIGGDASTWVITYTGFTAQQRAAFSSAALALADKYRSNVPIRVTASMAALSPGILGFAKPKFAIQNFVLAPLRNTAYSSALANAIYGADLVPGQDDIVAEFSTVYPLYYGLDGQVPADQYEFRTIVMHELTHGLGFGGSVTDMDGSIGSFDQPNGSIVPNVYDRLQMYFNGTSFVPLWGFKNNSTSLGHALRSGQLHITAFNTRLLNGGLAAKLYAPSTWLKGTSLVHLDEDSFPGGTADALMTPIVAPTETIASASGVALGVMADEGWAIAGLIPQVQSISPQLSIAGDNPVSITLTTQGVLPGVTTSVVWRTHKYPAVVNGDGTSVTASVPPGPSGGYNSMYIEQVINDRTIRSNGIVWSIDQIIGSNPVISGTSQASARVTSQPPTLVCEGGLQGTVTNGKAPFTNCSIKNRGGANLRIVAESAGLEDGMTTLFAVSEDGTSLLSAASADTGFVEPADRTLSVYGEHFTELSLVLLNGIPKPTEFVSDTELKVVIGWADIAGVDPDAVFQAAVTLPNGDLLLSNAWPFPVGTQSLSDVSCDSQVDANDALHELKQLAGLTTALACANGDPDLDGTVTIRDAKYIRDVAAGLIGE